MKKCTRRTKQLFENSDLKFVKPLLFLFITIIVSLPVKSQEVTFKKTSEALESIAGLEPLLYKLNTMLYLDNGSIKKFGEGYPLVIECDSESFHLLTQNNPEFINVNLIKLSINSPSEKNKIDLSLLKHFTELRYLQLVFTYDACGQQNDNCLNEIAKDMVITGENELMVLYSLSIPN